MLGRNTHFAIGVHIMTVLAVLQAREGSGPVSSSDLTGSVDTHPAFIRMVIGQLKQGGLVRTTRGPKGGAQLALPPSEIRLVDVYRAIQGEAVVARHGVSADADCAVACHMVDVLDGLSARIDEAIARELGQTTIEQIARDAQPEAFA